AFYETDFNDGTRQLSGAYTVKSFSAGVDGHGYADAFVKAGDNSMWEWTEAKGWSKILGANQFLDFAAVKGERAYFESATGVLEEFNGLHPWFLPAITP